MVKVAEIVQKVYEHLRGDLSLDSFRDWMVGAELELESTGEYDPARQLIWQLEARYAELSDGIIDEPSWKKLIKQLANDQRSGTTPVVVSVYEVPSAELSWGGNPVSNSIPGTTPQIIEPDLVAA